ncbi:MULTISPECIES: hypothetical protein [Shewanella]|uniref:Uncharacterized protein n=1 Tax=Shewanella xiamenensis TaxID=332186 RepID=A0AAE4TPB5_9GAMM|nr:MULTISPECIES: hypothetical protein [Shewanella]MDV5391628.1 hypothetical protein [Shewanella xiamenensis]PWH02084.1 hypothetical protein DIY08_14315 [Shewanella xiamenensis]BDQ64817.1 hypothetical protein NUITMVS2_06290 [Shewanella xiamenensis]GLD78015.1 hypothetical protein NUITMVS3_24460 [Shewanella xiamenensis]
MSSVLLSKYLYLKASESFSTEDYFGHGLVISLLQDSAEMLIWEMAKRLNISSSSKDGFVSLVDNIDKNHQKIFFKQQILELNQARVGFKHYGNLPSVSDLPKHINNCREFLIENSRSIGIDFEKLSSANLIRNSGVKKYVLACEEAMRIGNIENALLNISAALLILEDFLLNQFPIGVSAVNKIRDSFNVFQSDSHRDAQEFTESIADTFDEIIKSIAFSGAGYSRAEIMHIKSLCYSVFINGNNEIVSCRSSNEFQVSIENVRKILNFVMKVERNL